MYFHELRARSVDLHRECQITCVRAIDGGLIVSGL
jgi:hypothetical protein